MARRLEERDFERILKNYRNHLNEQPASIRTSVPLGFFDADDSPRFGG